MRGLIISGQGFVFLASEPQGWDTDTGKAATEYSVNAIFFPRVQVSRSHHVTIRVRLNQKTTEDPNEDMRGDVNDYK
jgi:pSer/pThr/pTyr-binding forkhead associated (FHA) protein